MLKKLKENNAEMVFLTGLVFITVPGYMIDLKLGLLITGLLCVIITLLLEGRVGGD